MVKRKKPSVKQSSSFVLVPWSWFMLEADLENNIAYGITINGSGEGEYGYTSLTELQGLTTKLGLTVERDTSFSPTPLKDINNEYLKKFLKKMYA